MARGRNRLSSGLAVCLFACSACGGGVQIGRIGPAVPLPSGQPRTACEREHWHELTPARVRATGVTAGFGYQVHHSQIWEGGGVFQVGEDDPEDLEDVFPEMREPELQRKHEARIQPVYDAHARSLYWALGGLAAMGTGIGIAVAIEDDSPTGAAVAGISGLALGLVGVFGALIAQPSGEEQLAADAREQLFVPGEDDMKTAARGVDRMNTAQRSRCR